jgi:release factor glutamine methyltransferase
MARPEELATLGQAVRWAGVTLRAAGLETPETDARWLIAGMLGLDRGRLIADGDRPLTVAEQAVIDTAVAARLRRAPVSRILGRRDFYGRSFQVTSAVLDPRADSETLVEAVLAEEAQLDGGNGPLRLLDIGTGSGCLLVTLLAELPEATGLGIDLSEAALAVARDNAEQLGAGGRAAFAVANLFRLGTTLPPAAQQSGFHVIVSNPPYIRTSDIAGLEPEVREHDPVLALDGGLDGLDAYRAIIAQAGPLLVPGGMLALELGAGQAGDVAAMIGAAGEARGATLAGISFHQDLAGHRRVLMCRRIP